MTSDTGRIAPAPLVAQLVGALRLLERHCRTHALGAPVELARFVDALAAQRGTQWPALDVLAEVGDSPGVPLLLTYEAAADALSLSPRTVRRLVADQELPVVSVGKARRIPRDALVEWVRTNQSKGAA